jgi:gliding motility-associated-like protein
MVTELAPIAFNLIIEDPSCNGYNDGGAGVNQISGGIGLVETDYNFLWEDGSTAIVRTDVLGNMLVSVTVTDAQGCSGTLEREIEDPAPVVFNIINNEPSCFALSDGWSEVTNISGPNGNTFDISWDNAAGNQTTARANNLTAGIYTVTVTDEEGCETIESTSLSQPEQLSLDYSAKDVECFGYSNGSISLTALGGVAPYTYSWPDGSNLATREGLIAGNYNILVTDSKGCEASALATLNQPVELIANIEAQAVSCFGERDGRIKIIVEGGTPPFRYSLDNDNYTTSNVLIGLRGGNYNLFIQDANNCQFLTNTTIPEPTEFMVDAGPDLAIVYGDSIELAAAASNAQGAVEFVWQAPYEGTLSCSECPKPFAAPEFTIDYELYAIDENGCEDTDFVRVLVDKPKLAVVPTGFTPNGDNMNDLLLVHGRPGTQVELFQVFDRWGELVYEAVDFPVNETNVGWDGNFRDEPMNSGVFVWFLSVIHEDGTQEGLRGQTMLIR